MPPWIMPTIAAILAVALLAVGTVAVVQHRQATEAREQRDVLAARVAELRAEVDELRADLEDAERRADDGAGLLDGLLDGDADLDDLLDGLLDDGLLDDGLLDGGLLDGGLDGLFEGDQGLFGGSGDGADGSAFDPTAAHGQACLDPGGGLLDGLDGLFGDHDEVEDLDALVDEVADDVARLRELDWEDDVEVTFLDADGTRERLAELSDPDEEELARLRGRRDLLAAFGAVPPELDLAEVQGDLLGDTVAGFYVPDTGETVVRVPDDRLPGPADRVTLAHELEHALADQVLGLPALDEPPFDRNADAALAALSVVEGDATLTMNLWAMEHLAPAELLALATDPEVTASADAFDDLPHVLVRELLFPYTVGLDWACDRYVEDGWAAIDDAYDDPPATSAEVLVGTPVTPTDTAPVSAPSGFEATYETTFGAADLLWQLEAPGDEPAAALADAPARAAAWAGGTAHVWRDGETTAAALSLAFTDDGGCDTLTGFADAAFAGAAAGTWSDRPTWEHDDRIATLDCDGTDVRLVVAPTRDALADVLD